jgi:hypothetical protein
VLSNPLSEAACLHFWYYKLSIEKGIPEYEHFHVKIITQIAKELRYSLDTIDKEDLTYYITKRYSEGLTWRYMIPLKLSLSPMPKVIREYHVYTQELIRNYLEKELHYTRSHIEHIYSSNKQHQDEQIQGFQTNRLIDNFSGYACPNFTVLLFGLTCYF